MKGFLFIRPLDLPDDILIGAAQIVSVEPEQRKRKGPHFALIRLSDGRMIQATEGWQDVLDLIEDAVDPLPPEAPVVMALPAPAKPEPPAPAPTFEREVKGKRKPK